MPIISGFPAGGNAKFPEGGKTDQVLVKTEEGESWGNVKMVAEKATQKPVSFQVTGLEGEEFTIEFTEDGEGGSGGVKSFNGRSGVVVPQTGDYTAEMVGSVPITRTVNGKSLSADITLDAAAIGADPTGSAASALSDAKQYADRLTASDVGAIPIVNGSTGQFLGFTSPNVVGAVDAPSNSGKRVCRFTVGTLKSGWRDNSCDYLCTGANDQVRINAAIQALPETGGEIVILDGTYNITAPIVLDRVNSTLRGNGVATVLKRMWNSSTKEGIVNVTADNCAVCDLYFNGNKTVYSSINNYGIYLTDSDNNIITGNTFNNNYEGIYTYLSNSNTITGNAYSNNKSGIWLTESNSNTITGNACNNNDWSVYLTSSNGNIVTGNTCNDNQFGGIGLNKKSNNNTIADNTLNDNNSRGIYLANSNNNTIIGNACNNNSYEGIYLTESNNNAITGNTCNSNGTGIYIAISNNNAITGNTCIRGTGQSSDYTSQQYTIYLSGTSNNYNLIANNNLMGKNYTSGGGTSNTFVNNKYN